MTQPWFNHSLYFVTEESLPVDRLLYIIEESIRGGVKMVQLREKHTDGKQFLEKALAVKALLDKHGLPLIINDRIDVALAAGAAGVHIGQDDLPLTVVRQLIPDTMIIGVSTQTLEQALLAETAGADYIGVGSLFPTSTKNDAILLDLTDIIEIEKSVSIPTVAIGGITLDNVNQVPKSFNSIAVVSSITKHPDPALAASHLLQNW